MTQAGSKKESKRLAEPCLRYQISAHILVKQHRHRTERLQRTRSFKDPTWFPVLSRGVPPWRFAAGPGSLSIPSQYPGP